MFQDVSVNAIRHERNIIAHDSLINKLQVYEQPTLGSNIYKLLL